MNYDLTNEKFRLALELVNQSSRNIFLTGKAGTGKTTFLKYIRENCPKQMAVVAPTGVAAINAAGVTIHSFFQLPFSPFIPVERGFSKNDETVGRHSLISRLRFNADKRKVLQELELLIIDEISMVRCDTMDAIDTVLRHIRKRPFEQFGGVQLLFIGDMFQLPPVIKNEEWKLMSDFYSSPYFFDSQVLKESPPLHIEFDKIYRQSEEKFINVLNQVRNNALDEEGVAVLDKCYQPNYTRENKDGSIVLTTHNETARNINSAELAKLNAPLFSFAATIDKDFPENAYPADETLHLKVGSQVMFIKNDLDRAKRYFNGKVGIITALEKDCIRVQCKDEPDEIEVGREKWDNIRYSLNNTSRQLEEETLGSFTQYPLRLAWAITIHKSQGLTFEKAIIDAGAAFAPGQVYVALSRCTNLEGMVLKSRVNANSLFTDNRIVAFSQNNSHPEQLERELHIARRNYQEKIFLTAFDFTLALNSCKEIAAYLMEYSSSFNSEALIWTNHLLERIAAVQETANKFHVWIKHQFLLPESQHHKIIQERVKKASAHFINEIGAIINLLKQSVAVTDSRQHAKEFNNTARELFAELSMKNFLLSGFDKPIDADAWHKRKREFVLPSFTINAYAGAAQQRTESPHPVLHQRLRKVRDTICSRKDLPIYIVAGSNTLNEMAAYLPQTLAELRKISGFGDAKINQYGQEFLGVILEYSKENNLSSLIHEKKERKNKTEKPGSTASSKKGETHAESLRLFKEGLSIGEIAKERSLTVGTIETHLAKFVALGQIAVSELLPSAKLILIEPLIKDFEGDSITPIKKQLGNDVSFGDIRIAIAHRDFKNNP